MRVILAAVLAFCLSLAWTLGTINTAFAQEENRIENRVAEFSGIDKITGRIITFDVYVDEITLERKIRRIFTGWMFADSPGLNAVEHPVYDIWLKNCKMESDVAPPS